MSALEVSDVTLEAFSNNSEEVIEITLYLKGELVGECKSHAGKYSNQKLSCDKVVADGVRLTLRSSKRTALFVYEISVSGKVVKKRRSSPRVLRERNTRISL